MQFAFEAYILDELFVGTEIDATDTYALCCHFLSVAIKVLYFVVIYHANGQAESAKIINGYGMTFGKPMLHLVNHTAHDLRNIALIQSGTWVTYLLDKVLGVEIAVGTHLIVASLFSAAVHIGHFAFDVFCHNFRWMMSLFRFYSVFKYVL